MGRSSEGGFVLRAFDPVRWAITLAAALAVSVGGAATGQAPLTLEDALRAAETANAQLPVAAREIDIAREKAREARADLWLKLAAVGDLIYAPSYGYDPIVTNLGEERIQLAVQQPIYDGGARRAAVALAEAGLSAAGARYRQSERDLDLAVRSRYDEWVEAQSEIDARGRGLERLRSYRTWLKSRQASGQGIASDVLRTEVRISSEEANLLEAEQRRDEARLELNDLMGRDPEEPLTLAALPEPGPGAAALPDAWQTAPELAAAEAETRAAAAGVRIARAERKIHLLAAADAGLWGSDTEHLIPPDLEASHRGATLGDRLRRDAGYSLSLGFVWPLWDTGGIRARIAESENAHRQAELVQEAERRRARLEWERAHRVRGDVYRQIEVLSRAVPGARDSYLEAESRYRGGAATSLEVLDAYAAWIDTQVRLADAVMRCRIAEALEMRWGTP
jgi:outer membrane protein